MINKKEFTARLQKIFSYYNINASSFAEKIDVGKASISHLLSGRNNPSLDFVMRVIKAFPEVDLYWLLNGTGAFPKNDESTLKTVQSSRPSPIQKTLFSEKPKRDKNDDKEKNVFQDIPSSTEIDRIVIFYKNGKFKSYTSI